MRRLGWPAFAALLALGTFFAGKANQRQEDAAAKRESRNKAALASGDTVLVEHRTIAAESAKVDSFSAGSRRRQAEHYTVRLAELAAADTANLARRVLATTLPALLTANDSLRVRTDMLRLAEQELGRVHAALARAVRHIAELERERDSLKVDRARLRAFGEEATTSVASLMAALQAQIDADECHIGPKFLHIACPSRKATAVATAVVSIAGTALVLGTAN